VINDTAKGRTIVPDIDTETFYYTLEFTPADSDGNPIIGGSVIFIEGSRQEVSEPVLLDAGFYNIVVIAYTDYDDVAKIPGNPVADKTLIAKEIVEGVPLTETITLIPLTGTGTFSWNITFDFEDDDDADQIVAEMKIFYLLDPLTGDLTDITVATPEYECDFDPFVANDVDTREDFTELDAGCYRVVFTLVDGAERRVERREILYVYANMESTFTGTFKTIHFMRRILLIDVSDPEYSNNTSGTLTRNALTPIEATIDADEYTERTVEFTVSIAGLEGADTITAELNTNSYGLTLDGTTVVLADGDTITLIYDGATEVTTLAPLTVTFTISNYGEKYTSFDDTFSASVKIIDGQDEARPIPVTQTNIQAFNAYANTTTGLTQHYQLQEDIILEVPDPDESNWTPIGEDYSIPFTGSFDGNDKTISDLTIYAPSADFQGLFGYIASGSTVKNLGLEGGSIDGNMFVGGIVGENSDGIISNCYTTGFITGISFVGGIAGNSGIYGIISNCYTTGSITGDNFVGGIAGLNGDDGTVSNCYTTGTITGDNFVGGIAGSSYQTVSNCYTTGTITGSNLVGGIVGLNVGGGTISDCSTTGNITGSEHVGGIVGLSESGGTVANCSTTGNITGESNIGGIVGLDEGGTYSNCYTTGNITGSGNAIGGIVGEDGGGTYSNCYTTGNITGIDFVGGIVAYTWSGIILNCYTTGTITGNSYVGGITGTRGNISNCIALNASVKGDSDVGRITGRDYASSNNYAWYGMEVLYNWDGTLGDDKTISNNLTSEDGLSIGALAATTIMGTWGDATGSSAAKFEIDNTGDNTWTWKGPEYMPSLHGEEIPWPDFLTELIEMVSIPAGSFIMGSPSSEPNRGSGEDQHSVTLTSGYNMGKYQVTQKQFMEITGSDPSNFKGDNRPVEITWYEAIVFCNKLSIMEGLIPAYSIGGSDNPDVWIANNGGSIPTGGGGNPTWDAAAIVSGSTGYRLPTEAEWEYACRGGYPNKATETATKPFGIGTGNEMLSGMANFNTQYPYELPGGENNLGSPDANNKNATTEVGDYKITNSYGLYDMHGNAYDWCWDWYDSYDNSFETKTKIGATEDEDPAGIDVGTQRVIRGGAYHNGTQQLRSAYRASIPPGIPTTYIGFRVVRP